jgi:hypothetical protein
MDKVRRTLVNPGIERASFWKNRTAFDIPWMIGVTEEFAARIQRGFRCCAEAGTDPNHVMPAISR